MARVPLRIGMAGAMTIRRASCGCTFWDIDEELLEDNPQIGWCPDHKKMKSVKVSTEVLIKNWTPNLCCSCGHRTYPPAMLPDLENLE